MNISKALTSNTAKLAIGSGLSVGMAASQAAVDAASVITELGTAATTVGAVGAAALSVVVVVKVFKYIRSAF
jgi:hypothetical protein